MNWKERLEKKKPEEIVPFVDGWDFVGVLGEGAFGEVRLVVNQDHNLAAAAKIVNFDELSQETIALVQREVKVHKVLKHKNIIRFYSYRHHDPWNSMLIFMEYASGGELFSKLKPDVGLSELEAQNYFRQLLEGVDYLHKCNFCHRDIKPENILFTENGRLKIIDFGNVTMLKSRQNNQFKKMDRMCGTPPYMAPEIWSADGYYGHHVDIWACGVVLCAMLSGELPWMKAIDKDENYAKWTKNEHNYLPWTNVSIEVISLCRRILAPNPSERISMVDLLASKWVTNEVNDETFSVQSTKRLKLANSSALSQPAAHVQTKLNTNLKPSSPDPHRDIEFILPCKVSPSLPVINDDMAKMMDYASQTQSQTQTTRNNEIAIKMPRASRIGLNPSLLTRGEIIQILGETLKDYSMTERVEGRTWRFAQNIGNEPLVIHVTLYDIEGAKIRLLDFARQRGDSILFRKVFGTLRKKFAKFSDKIRFEHKIKMDHVQEEEEGDEKEVKADINKENVHQSKPSQPMVDDDEKEEN